MATIRVNDVTLGIEQRGQRGNMPLVLLHGFTGSALSWDAHLDTFAAQGMHVLALDMLGHGQADAPLDPERYTIEHCRADILTVLKKLNVPVGRAVLLGYSMGGRIALYTALSGYFRALILESASPGLATMQERQQRQQSDELLAQRIERKGVPAFVGYWEQLPLFASLRTLSTELQQNSRQQRLNNRASGLANSLRGVGTGRQPALHEQLPMLHLPTLLLAGEMDSKFVAIARDIARGLPQAQLQIIPDAGHTIHLEQPAVFDRLVLNFCLSLSAHTI